jgi:hypothetical protein
MGGVYCQGYADDICLLAVRIFPNTASELMQRALHTMETWCGSVGMLVNPDKTDLVVFTRKRKLPGFFEPLLFGVTLHCSESVKYLGVTLDSRLTLREHVNIKVKKDHNYLWAGLRSFGATCVQLAQTVRGVTFPENPSIGTRDTKKYFDLQLK